MSSVIPQKVITIFFGGMKTNPIPSVMGGKKDIVLTIIMSNSMLISISLLVKSPFSYGFPMVLRISYG